MAIRETIDKRADIGRVDKFLQIQIILKISGLDILQYILLSLVAGVEQGLILGWDERRLSRLNLHPTVQATE